MPNQPNRRRRNPPSNKQASPQNIRGKKPPSQQKTQAKKEKQMPKKEFVKDLRREAKHQSHGTVVFKGSDTSVAALPAQLSDMIAISQYFAFALLRYYPNAYDVANAAAPDGGTITPTGVAAYCFLIMVQAANKLGLNTSSIPQTIECFPDTYAVPVVIAEWVRSYFNVQYAPRLSRTLQIATDIPIQSGSIIPWVANSPLSIGQCQFQTGTGLDGLSVFSRTVGANVASIFDRSLANTTFNYSGLFTGNNPFTASVEFRVINNRLSTLDRIGTIPFSSVNLVAPDYSAFVDPIVFDPTALGVSSWAGPNAQYYNCPSQKFNKCLAAVFQPNMGLAYLPRTLPSQQFTTSPVLPTLGVKGNFIGGNNVVNNAVIPPNQTVISEYIGKFFYVLMSEKYQTKGYLFGKGGHRLANRYTVYLDRMTGKTIDTAKLVTHLVGTMVTAIAKNYTNMAMNASDLNLIYHAASAMIAARIFEVGQPETFNLTGISPGTCLQNVLPDVDYLSKTLPPVWALVHNMIGVVEAHGSLMIPVWNASQVLNGIASNNFGFAWKFASMNINGNGMTASWYNNQGIGTFATNTPFFFGVNWPAGTYTLPDGGIAVNVVQAQTEINSADGAGAQIAPTNMLAANQVQGPINGLTQQSYNTAPKISSISAMLAFWSLCSSSIMLYINNLYTSTGGVNKSVLVNRVCKNSGYCTMFAQAISYTNQQVNAGGATGTGYSANILQAPAGAGPWIGSNMALLAFPFVEKRFLFDTFMSPAKVRLCVLFPMCTTYYAANTPALVVSGKYEHHLASENNQTYTTQFVTDISSEGSMVITKFKELTAKKKVDAAKYDNDIAVVKQETQKPSKDPLCVAMKDYCLNTASEEGGVTVNLDTVVSTAEHIKEGGTKPPDLYQLSEMITEDKEVKSEDDFNWGKAISTTAKCVAAVVPLLL